MIWANAVSFVNARVVTPGVDTPVAGSIRFSSRVLSIGGRPKPHDTIVDLRGAIVLPGLINAHDHLELNHYGRLKGRDRYENASAWIDDMRPRLTADPAIRRDRAQPLVERLFIGSLKNLLAGVTRSRITIRSIRRCGGRWPFAWCGATAGRTRSSSSGSRPGRAASLAATWRAGRGRRLPTCRSSCTLPRAPTMRRAASCRGSRRWGA
jgi:hypothetical protein